MFQSITCAHPVTCKWITWKNVSNPICIRSGTGLKSDPPVYLIRLPEACVAEVPQASKAWSTLRCVKGCSKTILPQKIGPEVRSSLMLFQLLRTVLLALALDLYILKQNLLIVCFFVILKVRLSFIFYGSDTCPSEGPLSQRPYGNQTFSNQT